MDYAKFENRQSPLQDRLAVAAESIRHGLNAPGLTAACILRSGEHFSIGVGLADVEMQRLMSAGARMLGGSTGKSIFAAAIMSATIDTGTELDAPVSRWLGHTAWFDRLPNARDLTLRHLLRHASGLPDHMGDSRVLTYLGQLFQENGPDAYLTPEAAIAFILDLPPIFPAGKGFFYSDTNYLVAGLALEAITGQTLYGVAQRYVLDPLEMTSTTPAVERSISGLAVPYLDGGLTPQRYASQTGALDVSPRTEWAGGGFVTNAADLATFIEAYASGRLLGGRCMNEVRAPNLFSWSADHVGAYGIGLFMADGPLGPSYGHGGYFPGYQSQMTYFPDAGIAVAYQCNISRAFTGYADIVSTRTEAAGKRIAAGMPLTAVVDDATRLALAALG